MTHVMNAMLAAHKEIFQASVNQWVNNEKARFAQKDEETTENSSVTNPLNQPVRSNGKS